MGALLPLVESVRRIPASSCTVTDILPARDHQPSPIFASFGPSKRAGLAIMGHAKPGLRSRGRVVHGGTGAGEKGDEAAGCALAEAEVKGFVGVHVLGRTPREHRLFVDGEGLFDVV